jgi:hypothetical protein
MAISAENGSGLPSPHRHISTLENSSMPPKSSYVPVRWASHAMHRHTYTSIDCPPHERTSNDIHLLGVACGPSQNMDISRCESTCEDVSISHARTLTGMHVSSQPSLRDVANGPVSTGDPILLPQAGQHHNQLNATWVPLQSLWPTASATPRCETAVLACLRRLKANHA